MGQPAVVAGDMVQGMCAGHQVPSPAGAPVPAPPLPFASPLTLGVVPDVLVSGKPVVVTGSSGYNTPPHVGLHPSDPRLVPLTQEGKVARGSSSVLAGGGGVAYTGCTVTACLCAGPMVSGTGTTVMVGP